MDKQKIALTGTLLAIGLAILYLEGAKPDVASVPSDAADIAIEAQAEKAGKYPEAKEIINPSGFINTDDITIGEQIGKKVVLVDFWTYSCINCQRTLPYLTAWHEKYKDKGLVIIGVHTPEFEFEKERDNVLKAAQKFGVTYPIVQDNDYSTWRAYKNRYWPRKYLIDIDGYIVYDHIGEGSYEETEKKIQELLAERRDRLGMTADIPTDIATPEAMKPSKGVALTPEVYFGAFRNDLLGNGTRGQIIQKNFEAPTELADNKFYLDGNWDVQYEYAENTEPGTRIILRYTAKDVFMVASNGDGVDVEVRRDGQVVTDAAGGDVQDGTVRIQESQLYHLIHEPGDASTHTLELIIKNPGLKAFTFTFG